MSCSSGIQGSERRRRRRRRKIPGIGAGDAFGWVLQFNSRGWLT
jgi:hypothetical protein